MDSFRLRFEHVYDCGMGERQAADLDDVMDELRAEVAVIAGRLNRDHADLVTLTVRLVEDGLWAGGGIRSAEHWLMLRAGLSPGRARDVVRLARRQLELAPTIALLEQGQLSIDQATEVARRVPAAQADEVTRFARNATVPQLRRLLARYPWEAETALGVSGGAAHDGASAAAEAPGTADSALTAADPTLPAGNPALPTDGAALATANGTTADADLCETAAGPTTPEHQALDPAGDATVAANRPGLGFGGPPELMVRDRAPASLSMSYDGGRFRLVYDAPADVGALVEAAIREAKDALFTAGRADATLGDAMTELANRSLSAVESTSRLDKYRVLVHLDTNGAWVNRRQALPRHLLEKITCDGVLQPVWEKDGKPVSVGRSMRIVPRRTRRLVEDRDRGCRFPGCTAVGFLENHHIDHWCDGGLTDYDTLVSLCPFHHDAVHSSVIGVCGDPTRPDGLEFRDCWGTLITGPEYSPPPPSLPRPSEVARTMVAAAGSAVGALWDQPVSSVDQAEAPYRGPTGEQLHPGWIEFAAS